MSVDHIRYDILTQDALRGVVRTVLVDAATKGLPGDHHFFIRFDTKADGVRISPRLKAQYPDDMTIVLQHQFWDLAVGEDSFEVGLSFNGIPERLTVPLAAIREFVDPSVGFQMAFAAESSDEEATNSESEAIETAGDATTVGPEALPAPGKPAHKSAESSPTVPDDSGAVVRLDQFRKKK
jgi:hypothetical protein